MTTPPTSPIASSSTDNLESAASPLYYGAFNARAYVEGPRPYNEFVHNMYENFGKWLDLLGRKVHDMLEIGIPESNENEFGGRKGILSTTESEDKKFKLVIGLTKHKLDPFKNYRLGTFKDLRFGRYKEFDMGAHQVILQSLAEKLKGYSPSGFTEKPLSSGDVVKGSDFNSPESIGITCMEGSFVIDIDFMIQNGHLYNVNLKMKNTIVSLDTRYRKLQNRDLSGKAK